MRITVGPTARLVQGDVLDVSKRALEERLRDLDDKLYVSWNPDKLNGHGCWELRRRPEYKTALHVATYKGADYFEVDWLETGINHIKDFAYLNYKILEWVKDNDLWRKFNYNGRESNTSNFIDNMERAEESVKEQELAKARAEMKYNIMQDRKIMSDLREQILSGVNPHLIGAYWNKSGS